MNDGFLKFSAPFIKSAKETFKTMMGTEITLHSPKLKENTLSTGDITALIGINGNIERNGKVNEFRGLLALSFPEDVYLKLASRMLGEEYKEYSADIADAGAECTNIILGTAKPDLLKIGIKLGLTTPSTVRGRQHEIQYPKTGIIVETNVTCDLGNFFMDLCYQDTNLK